MGEDIYVLKKKNREKKKRSSYELKLRKRTLDKNPRRQEGTGSRPQRED